MNGQLVEDDRIVTAWSLFTKSVEKGPDVVALASSTTTMTYRQLYDAARVVAMNLKSQRSLMSSSEPYVGLRVGRSFEYVIGAYGIMLAGLAFVPLGLDWPESRVLELKNKLKMTMVLDAEWIQDVVKNVTAKPKLFVGPFSSGKAYAICSSGSTGKPKCIAISHGAICNLVENQARVFECELGSRFYWMLSPVFDGALSDMFVALSTNSTLFIGQDFSPDVDFWSEICKSNATHIDIPPALLAALPEDDMPSCVQTLIVGGEQLLAKTIERFSPKCRLVNVYGPTEATICTSAKVYDGCSNITQEEVTVGKPFAGVEYALDPLTSELLIGGKQLACGYVPDYDDATAKLNKQKFVLDDFDERWFASGDIAKITTTGEYVIVGRIDRQVKVRGKLIAPEELEAIAFSECGLRTAVFKDQDGSITCAFESLDHVDTNCLLDAFAKKVPAWMIPSKFVSIKQAFPTLSSGKLDYIKIASIVSAINKETTKSNLESKSEKKLEDGIVGKMQQLFQDILKLNFVPKATASFKQDLNADSIEHVMLASKIRQEFGVQLGPCDFKNDDTPSGIAKVINASMSFAIPAKTLDSIALKHKTEILKELEDVGLEECKLPRIELGAIMLTGAAGFLGSYVLRELIERCKLSQVVCLVKASNNEEAEKKLLASVDSRYDRNLLDCNGRLPILALACDLSKKSFGLDLNLYQELCKKVKIVFHIAGEVNDWKDLDTLSASNIDATTNIVKFCLESEKRFGHSAQKDLVFASTLSVFVADTSLSAGAIVEEKPLQQCKCGSIASGYAQSKWIAESIVSSMVPYAKILRYGLLTPPMIINNGDNLRSGFVSKHNTLMMFLNGAKKLKALPEPSICRGLAEMKVDLTPVDFAAKATVAILDSRDQIFHVHAGMQVDYETIAKHLESAGVVKLVDAEQFSIAQDLNGKDEDVIACVEALSRAIDGAKYGTFDLFQSTGFTFKNDNLLKLSSYFTGFYHIDSYLRRLITQ